MDQSGSTTFVRYKESFELPLIVEGYNFLCNIRDPRILNSKSGWLQDFIVCLEEGCLFLIAECSTRLSNENRQINQRFRSDLNPTKQAKGNRTPFFIISLSVSLQKYGNIAGARGEA